VEVKTWQALYAMFLPERSGFGLNELLGTSLFSARANSGWEYEQKLSERLCEVDDPVSIL